MKTSAVLFLTLLAAAYQVNAAAVRGEDKGTGARPKLPELELPRGLVAPAASEAEEPEQAEQSGEEASAESFLYKLPGARLADYVVGTAIDGGRSIGEAVGDGAIATIDTAQKIARPFNELTGATIGKFPGVGQVATGTIDLFDNFLNGKKEFLRIASRRNNQGGRRPISNLFSL